MKRQPIETIMTFIGSFQDRTPAISNTNWRRLCPCFLYGIFFLNKGFHDALRQADGNRERTEFPREVSQG